MIAWFSNHERKRLKRSPTFSRNSVINAVLIFFIVIMLLYMLGLGFVVDLILLDQYPDKNVVTVFNGFVLSYVLVDLLMRFYLQEVPALEVQPYLHLPVKRSSIVHFVLRKSVFTLFNLLPLFLLLPFLFKQVIPEVGNVGYLWAITIYSFSLCSTYLTVFLKKQLISRPQTVFYLVIVCGILFLLNHLDVLPLTSWSATYFGSYSYLSVAIPLIFLVVLYALNYNVLKSSLYLEELGKMKKEGAKWSGDFSFLKRFGSVGEMMSLELKLILRNKRPRSVLFTSIAFLFYGLIFYTSDTYREGYGMLIFAGIFVTGGFMLNYGQFAFSWESGFFDTILTKRINIRKYLEAKYNLLAIACVVSFVLTTPYVYFGYKVLLINVACTLFNIGVNTIIILYLTGKSPKRIDISKPNVMNWEGVGATQFILIIPTLLAPIFINAGFWFFDLQTYGIVTIGLVGIVGILFRKQLLERFYQNRFIQNKYQIAQSLRIE
ncbi:MAG: DUF5687 family protein [Bacteroidota bacterium]